MKNSTYRIIDLIKIGKDILSNNKNPYIESEIIVMNHLSLTKEELLLSLNREVSKKEIFNILSKFERRKRGEPLFYITGEREFLSRNFIVFKGVFIPRFETEEIVYHVVNRKRNFDRCLDMCAGTGVIGITLLMEKKVNSCTFVDINPLAIKNIKKNLKRFGLKGKVLRSNMFNKVRGKFDLIISNPPYIPEDMLNEVDDDVKREPIDALNGGKDGLKFIKILLSLSDRFLKRGGELIFEYPEFVIKEPSSLSKRLKFKEKIPTLSEGIKGAVFTKL